MEVRPLHDRVLVKRFTEEEKSKGGIIIPDTEKVERELNKLIKKVTGDIENFSFNTSISAFMEFHNAIKDDFITLESVKKFLTVLYPFAPLTG